MFIIYRDFVQYAIYIVLRSMLYVQPAAPLTQVCAGLLASRYGYAHRTFPFLSKSQHHLQCQQSSLCSYIATPKAASSTAPLRIVACVHVVVLFLCRITPGTTTILFHVLDMRRQTPVVKGRFASSWARVLVSDGPLPMRLHHEPSFIFNCKSSNTIASSPASHKRLRFLSVMHRVCAVYCVE